jgi:DNA-binding CsgD family transcriptional regulator
MSRCHDRAYSSHVPTGPGRLLADVAERGDLASVVSAARDALRDWVGAGPVFLALADPLTGSFTGTYTFDIPDDAAAAFFAIEMSGRDVASFSALAGAPTPLASLYAATKDRPQTSARWREVIQPLGWGDELRAAVRGHGSTWGYVCIHRQAHERPFGPRDRARLDALLPALVAAMRRATWVVPAGGTQLGTGVVLVDRDLRVAATTEAATAWLDELGPHRPNGLPLLLAGVVRSVLDSGRPAAVTVTTRTGRLGSVEAAPLRRDGEDQLVVVISPAPRELHLERLAAASGLTAREHEVVCCILAGSSTEAIATQLRISPHTVQAHLTSVFGKTGLRSRRELVARLRP